MAKLTYSQVSVCSQGGILVRGWVSGQGGVWSEEGLPFFRGGLPFSEGLSHFQRVVSNFSDRGAPFFGGGLIFQRESPIFLRDLLFFQK